MEGSSAGFVTHQEMDDLLGGTSSGSRARRRLVGQGLLPKIPMIRSGRKQLGIYPDVSLASLVLTKKSSNAARKTAERISKEAGQLYKSKAYSNLATVIVDCMRYDSGADVVGLMGLIRKYNESALEDWNNEVRALTDVFRDRGGLEFESSIGRVIESHKNFYVVKIESKAKSEKYDSAAAPKPIGLNTWVALDRVGLGSSFRNFLLPISVPTLSKFEHDHAPMADDGEEAFVRALLEDLDDEPYVSPAPSHHVEAIDEPSAPVRVSVPWELLGNANPMSRRRSAT